MKKIVLLLMCLMCVVYGNAHNGVRNNEVAPWLQANTEEIGNTDDSGYKTVYELDLNNVKSGEFPPGWIADDNGTVHQYILNDDGSVGNYDWGGNLGGGGARMFGGFTGGDFTKALYWRSLNGAGYATLTFGEQVNDFELSDGTYDPEMPENIQLYLEPGKYQISFLMAAWKFEGEVEGVYPKFDFLLQDVKGNETFAKFTDVEARPCTNGGYTLDSPYTGRNLFFTIENAGFYMLRFQTYGYKELLLAKCNVLKIDEDDVPNDEIWYEASSKLSEHTVLFNFGLRTNAFNVAVTSHTFSGGKGIIRFDGDVASIGDGAFFGCFGLTSIEIPNSVTSIGNSAFYGCSSLTSIKIPNSVTDIGGWAFTECSSLTNIAIPNSVTNIGTCVFSGCSSLTSIAIPNSVTSIGVQAFFRSSLTSITIPSFVTSIGLEVFGDCPDLTSIIVDSKNTNYDSRDDCNAIIETASNTLIAGCKNTTIPNSVTSIGDYAFSGCSGLTNIEIPNSVTSIGNDAFSGCSSLTSIAIPNSVTSIGYYAFNGCSSLTSIEIPNSVTSIGYGAFTNCFGLTSIEIPNSVTSIGEYAFSGCSGLTSIEIPNSVTSIGNYAFAYCYSLSDVYVSWETPLNIPADVFYNVNNNNCTILHVPVGTKSLYVQADGWKEFGIVEQGIPDNEIWYTSSDGSIVTPYNTNAFGASMQSNTYSNGRGVMKFDGDVTSIGNEAFYNCSNLSNIEIPKSVISIGEQAFSSCYSLASIEIPDSVTSIGHDAFMGCSGLESFIVNWQKPLSINSSVFMDVQLQNCTLHVPADTKPLYQQAEVWKDFGTIVEQGIPDNEIWYTSSEKLNETTDEDFACLRINAFNATIISHEFSNGKGIIKFDGDVTRIGHGAFFYCSGLTSIEIPNSVANIGGSVFYGCSGLTSIEIPTSVTSIGGQAFSYSGLTSITIPNSVTNIGNSIFSGCSSLTSIYVESGNSKYDSRNNCNAIITTSFNTLIAGCKNTIIPNSVTSIGYGAFAGCSGLTSIEIPNSVTSLEFCAFENCSDLTSIKISNSVSSIGYGVFSRCPSLTSIIVESGNSKYDSRSNCNAIIETSTNALILGCRNTVIPYSVTSIGDGAFSGCSDLTSVEIPNSVTSIGEWAFNSCSGLTRIEIPHSVSSIGDGAFSGCSGLTSIEIPNSVTSIGSSAFSGCSSLISIEIPHSVSSIGDGAFYGCSGLTSIEIPNSVTSIGSSAFSGCSSLISIEIPNSVTSIGNDAFYGCSGLTSIEIPNSVTSIGSSAFSGCSSLISIEIPNSVTSIGGSAFSYCSGLTSIEIPNSVTSIGEYAFAYCYSLSDVYVSWETPLNIPADVFGNDKIKDCTLYVPAGTKPLYEQADGWKEFGIVEQGIPDNEIWYTSSDGSIVTPYNTNAFGASMQGNTYSNGRGVIKFDGDVTSIGNEAFYNCSNLSNIEIPKSVISIGEQAFSSCYSLASIEIPDSVTSIGHDAFMGCSGLESFIVNWQKPLNINSSVFMDVQLQNCTLHVPADTKPLYQQAEVWKDFGTIVEQGIPDNEIWYTSSEKLPEVTDVWGKGLHIEGFGKSIVSHTFSNGKGIIKFDGVVTRIGEHAFYCCSGLTNIEIPNSVANIGDDAFYGCSSLTSITIPNSVKSIGVEAFRDCSALTSIDIPNSVTSIGNYAFGGCSGLTSIEIPNSVTSIGGQAFAYSGLTNIIIPNSVTSISGGAFSGCSSLTSIIVESGNTKYDSRNNCNAIIETATNTLIAGCKNTTIPNSVTSIGYDAFNGCSGLTSIAIPNSVTSIGYYAFNGCSSLTSIEIPNSVTSIEGNAFNRCSDLTSIEIPNSVTSIGWDVFSDCSSLASITVESGNTNYDSRNSCNAIIETASNTLITGCQNTAIPNSVTSIGDYAFYGCSGLTSIEIPNSVTSIGASAFRSCSSLTSIEIPNSVTSIGNGAFYVCSGLKKITIPNSVTSIGGWAFGGHLYGSYNSLSDVYVSWETPLNVPADVFDNVNIKDCTLHVPADTKPLYEQADVWKDFGNIDDGTFVISVDQNVFTYTGKVPALKFNCEEGYGITIADGDLQKDAGNYNTVLHITYSKDGKSGKTELDYSYTINKASLTMKVDNQSRSYGSANPTLTYSFSGFVNNETESVLSSKSVTTSATQTSDVGEYDIIGSATAKNYDISITNGKLTINKAPLAMKVDNQSRSYGSVNPTLTYSFSGFVNNETESVLSSKSVTTSATQTSDVGEYDIIGSATAKNYDISITNGKLTIDKVSLTMKVNNQSRSYGSANPTLTYAIYGFVNNETESVLSSKSVTTSATQTSDVGEYDIIGSATAKNYDISITNGKLTVSKVPLTIKAYNSLREYGDSNGDIKLTYTGFVNGEDENVLSESVVITTAGKTDEVGTYDIILSGAEAKNYEISYVNAQLMVTKAPLKAIADDKAKEYGTENPELTVRYEGWKNGEDESVLTGKPQLQTTATRNSAIGSYPIIVSGGSARNYEFTEYVNGTLTISNAVITITAVNTSRVYGDRNPQFEYVITGLKPGDTESVITNQPTFTCSATEKSDVGVYDIMPGNATAANYSVNYAKGTLTVTKRDLKITAENKSRKYGEENPEFTMSYDGLVNGDDEGAVTTKPGILCDATTASYPGTYPIVLAGNAVAQNYEISLANGVLTVEKLDQSIIWNQDIPTLEAEGELYEISATATSGLDVEFGSSDEEIANIFYFGGTYYLNPLTAGTVKITATQQGSGIYEVAEPVVKVVTIGASDINDVTATTSRMTVYTMQGVLVGTNMTMDELKDKVPAGFYIVNGKKMYIK